MLSKGCHPPQERGPWDGPAPRRPQDLPDPVAQAGLTHRIPGAGRLPELLLRPSAGPTSIQTGAALRGPVLSSAPSPSIGNTRSHSFTLHPQSKLSPGHLEVRRAPEAMSPAQGLPLALGGAGRGRDVSAGSLPQQFPSHRPAGSHGRGSWLS